MQYIVFTLTSALMQSYTTCATQFVMYHFSSFLRPCVHKYNSDTHYNCDLVYSIYIRVRKITLLDKDLMHNGFQQDKIPP